ncbi:MAG: hypothetical protein GY845_05760 [Planctomycetes bacterium]|nr:hypothetical protein [Planctomycetota bacterium]
MSRRSNDFSPGVRVRGPGLAFFALYLLRHGWADACGRGGGGFEQAQLLHHAQVSGSRTRQLLDDGNGRCTSHCYDECISDYAVRNTT